MPTKDEVGWLGLSPDAFEGPPVLVWPENITVTTVFLAMSTQWRHGFGGPTGLDYGALPEVWRRLKVAPDERDAVFHDLRVIEAAALNQMHKKD